MLYPTFIFWGSRSTLYAVSHLYVSGDAMVLLDYMKVEFSKFTQDLSNLRSDFFELLASKLMEVDYLKVQVSIEKQIKNRG